MGVESVVVAPKDEPASRHIEAADRSIEIDFEEAKGIPTDQLPAILEQAGADAAHLGYQGQPEMFELASAAEQADVAVVGTDLDVLGALTDQATIRAAAERAHVRTVHDCPDSSRPREIGVLVAADSHGATCAIAECDRSLSTSEHTLIHETPSPELLFRDDGEAFRMALFESARRLSAELRYAGLLEVRFHIDPSGLSWVSDVTIGLPRYHTLMEMVTRVDLVALQLRIASRFRRSDPRRDRNNRTKRTCTRRVDPRARPTGRGGFLVFHRAIAAGPRACNLIGHGGLAIASRRPSIDREAHHLRAHPSSRAPLDGSHACGDARRAVLDQRAGAARDPQRLRIPCRAIRHRVRLAIRHWLTPTARQAAKVDLPA
jgi:biotin carboxylase